MANGDQPWDRTTFSRSSAERYDHTSSLVGWSRRWGSNPLVPAYGAGWLPLAPSALVQARRFAPRSSDNRSEVLLLDEAWSLVPAVGVEPTLFRLKGGHAAAASRWQYDNGEDGARFGDLNPNLAT
jgi:hypothetical protein